MDSMLGTLLFNLQGQLLYFNRQARIYLSRLNVRLENSNIPPQLPEEILFLFQKTRDNLDHERPEGIGEVEQSIMPNKNEPLLLRSFALGDQNRGKSRKLYSPVDRTRTRRNPDGYAPGSHHISFDPPGK